MKLELVKKYEPDNIDSHWGCVVTSNETLVSLVMDKDNLKYALLFISLEEMKFTPLDYLETSINIDSYPVLFSAGNGFGIIKNVNELYYYKNIDSDPEIIEINNRKFFKQVLPVKSRLGYPNPVSDSPILPVCFQHTTFSRSETRYLAFLDLNIEKRKAKWENWTNLNEKQMLSHDPLSGNPLPKLDSVMIKDNDIFVFTSGDQIVSVSKWGMDYYGIFKISKKGEVTDTLLDSGNLHLIDQKKRGVNGVFTSSQQYAILTPVFQSDEWKGKQKLFSMATGELIDIEFPRGFGKYPRIVQHCGKYFWVYLWDTRHFAICREV